MTRSKKPLCVLAIRDTELEHECRAAFRTAAVVTLSTDPASADSIVCNASDALSVVSAFQEIENSGGLTASLIVQIASDLPTCQDPNAAASLASAWTTLVLPATLLAQQAIQQMLRNGGGTLIFITHHHDATPALESALTGLEGLCGNLSRQYENQSVHIVRVLTDQNTPADRIAAACLEITQQPATLWRQSLDLRDQPPVS